MIVKEENIEGIFKNLGSSLINLEFKNNSEWDEVINQFQVNIPIIEIIEKETNELLIKEKKRFNIFIKCLTKHHLEELHSKFIYYLLNPKETHDCGTLFLELFIETLKEDEFINEKIKKLNVNYNFITTTREKYIGRSWESDIYGFIDILIEFSELNIVIENKIKAPEQENQIERYVNYCKNQRKDYIALYLTVDGYESAQAGDEEYFLISYRRHILSWLEKCINETIKRDYSYVFPGLHYYKELLNNKIFNTTPNPIIMKIKELLLKPENRIILKHLKEINDSIIEIRDELRIHFFNIISKKMLEKKYEFIPVADNFKPIRTDEIWIKPLRGFRITDNRYILNIDLKKIYFSIQHDKDDFWFGLICANESNEIIACSKLPIAEKIASSMNRKLNHSLDYTDGGGNWFLFKNYYPLNKEMKFIQNELNYDFAENMEGITNEFISEVEKYLAAWQETIEEVKS